MQKERTGFFDQLLDAKRESGGTGSEIATVGIAGYQCKLVLPTAKLLKSYADIAGMVAAMTESELACWIETNIRKTAPLG